ncbi:serine/threonine-protein kinase [Nonomuraea sp. NPDC049421]|uniref:serine/threonine-protein kinase n=1 Tax=Nonomuraea sp. NPDC049421 TaxID=3155275 RepID=UPI003441BF8A
MLVIDKRYALDPESCRKGGMGEIWTGYDKRLDRSVAVKIIRVDRLSEGQPKRELIRRFVREARATARLEHPGVPAVYDCGTWGEDLYMVLQLVNGRSLDEIMRAAGAVPAPWAVAIAAQVCSVLAVAHDHQLVHRDITPANLMLCRDGSVKVLDFGVAALLTPSATQLTETGIVLGTPRYMAPEQAMSGTTSPQSDLYALGVVLREMLTGPAGAAGPTEPATDDDSLLAGSLQGLLTKLLATSPAERPPSATAAHEILVGLCGELPPFPGYVDTGIPHPLRMYADALGRLRQPSCAVDVAKPPPSSRSGASGLPEKNR